MSNKICLNKYIGKCNFELTIVICIQMRDITVYSIAEYYSVNSTCLTERERERERERALFILFYLPLQ